MKSSIEAHTSSTEANRDDFLIGVSLPASYGTGDPSYQLVYVLDANISFGMTVEIARLHQMDLIRPGVPEMVLVGIGYPDPYRVGTRSTELCKLRIIRIL